MSLSQGTKLGAYEILAPIGAGGMGEVYRARDSKLGREVAIKVLPEEFTQHPQKLARFEREARLLATLNHPGIATIYEVEESEGKPFLVMELVEGQTLAERISLGPIPVGEALEISRQIAEALEAAHEKGVIHRDLKPANIKVDPEGKVKVLDFGLAKAFADEVPESELSQSPTLSRDATRAGVILGTAAYMSPEQAKGKTVDKRSDIFSFGIVLYEMLTGKRAFAGEDVSDVLASIIKLDIDWTALPYDLDPRIRKLLTRCLKPDRKKRLRDVGDVRNEIEEILTEPAAATAQQSITVSLASRVREKLAWAIAVAALLASIAVWNLTPQPARPVGRFVIGTPATEPLEIAGTAPSVAVSPDGTRIAYRTGAAGGNQGLYLRHVDQLEGTRIFTAVTVFSNPFFSPDGTWVGFSTFDDQTWKKVSVLGGPPVTLFPSTTAPRGATWGPDDTIVFAQFSPGTGLFRGPAGGGEPEVLTTPDGEQGELAHRWPEILPGGEAVLFNIVREDGMEIAVLDLATGEQKVLVPNGSNPKYADTGHLVYGVEGALLAAPFNLDRLDLAGDPVPVLEGVMTDGSGVVQFGLAAEGALVYATGDPGARAARTLVLVDREGREEVLAAEPRAYTYPRISPDGSQVALDVRDQENDVWIWDFARENLTRLTFHPRGDGTPTWTPDGRHIAFSSARAGPRNLYWKAADGTGTVERLTESENYQWPDTFSSDGTQLVYWEAHSQARRRADLGVLSVDGGSSEPLLVTEFDERNVDFSPNGQWLAYQSDASGDYEIYAQPFPDLDEGRWQISRGGGVQPLWARNGSQLFYLDPAGRLMAVPVRIEPSFNPGSPEPVFEHTYYSEVGIRTYDVHPDGQRFLMIKEGDDGDEATPTELIVVLNWFEELKRLVPTN